MASLLGLLHAGAASLSVGQMGVGVHGGNIANARTPGYARRDLLIEEGGGGMTRTRGLLRSEDFVLSQKIAQQQGTLLHRSRLADGLREVEQVLRAGQSDLSHRVAALASSLSELAPAPHDLTRRTEVIERGRSVASEFNRLAHSLGRLQVQAMERAQRLLPRIAELARQLATLNQKVLHGAGGAAAPDAALAARTSDLRDELARTLAGLVGGDVLRNADGAINVLLGGLSVVHGAVASPVEIKESASGVQVLVGGAPLQVAVGGELGAELAIRDVARMTLAQLDRLAFDFSAALNAQHAFGVGLDGVGGRPFFSPPGAVAGAALRLEVDPQLTPQTLAVGFTAQRGDNRNALALSNLIDQPLLEGGRASFRNVYARVASQLGFQVQRAADDREAAQEQADALDRAREAVAGVQTDEEMVRLMAYQRGFEASARFIRTIDQMLDRLINL
ncbi:MAG: flagellar hook-associated protein FlgK [Myxococcota bacterium]|nr:flagellar hook-associated protein FlgK [Myxococcota bacterium]